MEQPHQGQGDDTLVDYGLATLCSVLAQEGVDEVIGFDNAAASVVASFLSKLTD